MAARGASGNTTPARGHQPGNSGKAAASSAGFGVDVSVFGELQKLQYSLGESLGKGAFGTVFKGLDVATGEFVAVKQIALHDVPRDQVESITMEIELLKKLNHKNIVQYLGCYGDDGNEHLNIVLEYVENGSLAGVIKKFGKFPETLVRLYISQVLEGLVYLHEQGVIHRDIKGANILITKQGLVKVADFGVSTKLGDASPETLANDVAGSPYWMAPEIIELSGATTESDVWSVGCVVIELLTTAPPYFDLPAMSALFHIVEDEFPPIPPEVSPALKDFLMQCFQKDANLRVSARKLLLHRWIKAGGASSPPSLKQDIAANRTDKPVDNRLARLRALESPRNRAAPAADALPAIIQEHNISEHKLRQKIKRQSVVIANSPVSESHATNTRNVRQRLQRFATGKEKRSIDEKDTKKKKKRKKTKSKEAEKKVGKENGDTVSKKTSKTKNTKKVKRSKEQSTSDAKRTKRKSTKVSAALLDLSQVDKGAKKDSKAKKPASDKHKRKSKPLATYQDEDDPFGDDFDFGIGDGSLVVQKLNLQAENNIRAFADSSGEEDDWDDLDLPSEPKTVATTPKAASKPVFVQKDEDEEAGLSSGDELDFAAKLRDKLKTDEDQILVGDDPFAEGFDDDDDQEFDVEKLMIEDELSRTSAQILKLMSLLHRQQQETTVIDACDKLHAIFAENPGQKGHLIRHHGVIPILEMIDVSNTAVVQSVLRVLNQIIEGSAEIQENLCMLGAIPTVIQFASSTSRPIRVEVARFIKQMCSTSALTLQMFIGCRGQRVLGEYLSARYSGEQQEKELVLMAVDAVIQLFHHSASFRLPRNDFSRLFANGGLLGPLIKAFGNVATDKDTQATVYSEKICDLLLMFSQSDTVVKRCLAEVSGDIMGFILSLPGHLLVKLLRVLRNISMDSTTLDRLSHAIPRLVALLLSSALQEAIPDMEKQIMPTLFNLLRISNERQQAAARAGIIPYLMQLIRANSPLKQFALPIIAQMPHRKEIRAELWKHKAVDFFIDTILLEIKTTWPATLLESLLAWKTAEPDVERVLIQRIPDIVRAFRQAVTVSFVGMLEPLLKMITTGAALRIALRKSPEFINLILEKPRLLHPDPLVRVNVLKIASAMLVEVSVAEPETVRATLRTLLADPSIVVQNLAAHLLPRIK